MKYSRRTFLAASSGSLAGALASKARQAAASEVEAEAGAESRRRTATLCSFCAVGCGAIVTTTGGRVSHVEGDPDHPISRGSLCAKGIAMARVAGNPHRLTRVQYRAPGATAWEPKSWDWAIRRIAQRAKAARDRTFITADRQGRTVNRTEAIGVLGGATLGNEECYTLGKLARAMGIVFLEHQGRICHSASTAALSATFGFGAMTNSWTDLANADAILAIGANPAENHPIAMKWIGRATEAGATLVSVDPRFTRTSAVADLYVPLRAGTDIALIGGLIRHALEHGLVHREYLVAHTNAAHLIDPAYRFDDGRFGPMRDGRYRRASWGFQETSPGHVATDPTLEHPLCVFQKLKRHFARYTPEVVADTCGTPADTFERLAEVFLATCRPDRSGTILYCTGATQHTSGTQVVRSYAILQLLLGNVGVAGGGVNALQGEANAQGSSDHGLLFDFLPGYLRCPTPELATLAEYTRAHGGCGNRASIVSLLKAWWGPHATAANDFAYDHLPKHSGDCSYLAMFEAMRRGQMAGLLAWGQNPATSGPDLNRQREALGRLDWLVVVDPFETETASFWKRPGVSPEEIGTEVFLLPAAYGIEKEGSLTNSARWAQWRHKAADPPGEARSDLWIVDQLGKQLGKLYAAGGVHAEPIVQLTWNQADEPDPHEVAREINGKFLAKVMIPGSLQPVQPGDLVPLPSLLRDDGSTSAGNPLYCGGYTAAGNQMARREASSSANDPLGLHARWAWAWPANQRVLYNRAGCDSAGRPWSGAKALVAFDPQRRAWLGDVGNVSDLGAFSRAQGTDFARDEDGLPGNGPFPILPQRKAMLFAPSLVDGPFPEHYEPLESPVANPLSPQQTNPMVVLDASVEVGDATEYPIVATTCRVAEHWGTGSITRNVPWLVELVPDAFVEISRELAQQRGIRGGDRVTLRSARGEVTVYALVTGRLKPLRVGKRLVEQVALVWHFGYQGMATGASANLLTPHVGDANTRVPEYKAFLCEVEKA